MIETLGGLSIAHLSLLKLERIEALLGKQNEMLREIRDALAKPPTPPGSA